MIRLLLSAVAVMAAIGIRNIRGNYYAALAGRWQALAMDGPAGLAEIELDAACRRGIEWPEWPERGPYG